MPEPNQPFHPPVDPLWEVFDAAEQHRMGELYGEIEQRNQGMLNMAAGLEAHGVPIAGGRAGLDGPILDVTGGDNVMSFELQLRPDTRQQLASEGRSAEETWAQGEGAVVVGDMPERTKQLIDDLLRGIEGRLDEARSTPTTEMWAGNVAGQPIWVQRHYDHVRTTDELGNPVQLPVVSMKVCSLGYIRQVDEAAAKRAARHRDSPPQ